MNKNNFGYLMREGVRGVFLHGFRSFAAVCVTVACLIIMGSFCLISLNLNEMVAELENENEILVYIDESYSEAEAKSVGSQINLIANVENAVFVSRQTALEHFVSEQDDPTIFDGIEAQTLRDRYEVSLIDNSIMKQTVSEIEAINGVVKTNAHYEISDGFQTLRNVLNLTSAVIILVLLIVSLFIISNTVKLALYDRKEEIAIMRMVGATNNFIRLPFVVEGFLLGMIGAVSAFFLEWLLYDALAARIEAMDTMQMFRIIPFTSVIGFLIPAFVIVGFLVGVLGSLLSIRKFLRV